MMIGREGCVGSELARSARTTWRPLGLDLKLSTISSGGYARDTVGEDYETCWQAVSIGETRNCD